MKIDKKVMEANNVRNEGKPQFTVTAARRSKDGSLLLTRCKYIVEDGKKVSKSVETFYSPRRAADGTKRTRLLEVSFGWLLLACTVWALTRYVL